MNSTVHVSIIKHLRDLMYLFVCAFQYSLNSIIQITKQEVKDRYEEEIERYIYAHLLS